MEKASLEKQAAALQKAAGEKIPRDLLLRMELKQLARQAGSRSKLFRNFLDVTDISNSFPIEVAKCLESELRVQLRAAEGTTLSHLISAANAADILTDEGVDLAHLIRRQRNVVAHDGAARMTYPVRSLLALAAAALFWSEL